MNMSERHVSRIVVDLLLEKILRNKNLDLI